MGIDKTNLVFLISLPRSGSTLTQRILGEHSMFYTRSEPWIMLNPLYSLKKTGIDAEYNKNLEYVATQDFIEGLPGGRKKYVEYLANAYRNMYRDYLKEYQKSIFLDKTPRYYLIIDGLKEMFPDAKLILLVRNPLAVLSSLINTLPKNGLNLMRNYKVDIVEGLNLIVDQLSGKRDDFFLLRYEDLLSDQSKTMKECFSFLKIPYEDKVFEYHSKDGDKKWLYGDQQNVYEKKGIDTENDMKWVSSLDDPQRWRLLNDYLHYIGKERFELLGYDFAEMEKVLLEHLPGTSISGLENKTISLFELLQTEEEKMHNELESLKENNAFLEKRINDITQSRLYRVGDRVLKPYRWIKKKFIS